MKEEGIIPSDTDDVRDVLIISIDLSKCNQIMGMPKPMDPIGTTIRQIPLLMLWILKIINSFSENFNFQIASNTCFMWFCFLFLIFYLYFTYVLFIQNIISSVYHFSRTSRQFKNCYSNKMKFVLIF